MKWKSCQWPSQETLAESDSSFSPIYLFIISTLYLTYTVPWSSTEWYISIRMSVNTVLRFESHRIKLVRIRINLRVLMKSKCCHKHRYVFRYDVITWNIYIGRVLHKTEKYFGPYIATVRYLNHSNRALDSLKYFPRSDQYIEMSSHKICSQEWIFCGLFCSTNRLNLIKI